MLTRHTMTLDRPPAKGAHAVGSKAPRRGWRGDGTFERPPRRYGRGKLREIVRLVSIVGETSKFFRGDFPFKIRDVTFLTVLMPAFARRRTIFYKNFNWLYDI